MPRHDPPAPNLRRANLFGRRMFVRAVITLIAGIILSGCSVSAEELVDVLNQWAEAQSSFAADPTSGKGAVSSNEGLSSDAPVTNPFTVTRVVDGDTIWVEDDHGEKFKVRIIGVDAPETEKEDQDGEPFAEEAYAFAQQTLSNRIVYLERDVSDVDQYDRLLRYVWLDKPANGDKETFERLNFSALLIRGGYARAVAYGEDTRYESELRALERLARTDNLGMWAYS